MSKNNIKTVEFTLPASWASYLVNNDASGLSGEEISDADFFIATHFDDGTMPSATCGDSYFAKSNDANKLAQDVCDFTFLVDGKKPAQSQKTKWQIVSVRIEQKIDESPDLSFLGEFTDSPVDGAIIRETGEMIKPGIVPEFPEKSREFRFFLPAMTGEESGNLQSPFEDWKRMESYNRGEWQMLGIIAKAEIRNPVSGAVQTIHSGGLWGVESDSGDYLKEVAREQLAELKAELLALNNGIGERAIAYAIKNCKV